MVYDNIQNLKDAIAIAWGLSIHDIEATEIKLALKLLKGIDITDKTVSEIAHLINQNGENL